MVATGEADIFLEYNHRPATEVDRKDKPTVLFVHGWPDTHKTWEPQMKAFSEKWNVAAMDLRGAGESSPARDEAGYRVERILPDLNAVMDYLVGPHEKIHLVGHDWGAVISWCFASDTVFSRRLLSYTAISCPHPRISLREHRKKLMSFNPLLIWKTVSQIQKSWYIFLFQLPFLPEFLLSTYGKTMWKRMLVGAQIPRNDPMWQMSLEEIQKAAVHPVNLYRQLMRYGTPDFKYKISVPVQIIIPKNDLAIAPESYDGHEKYATNIRYRYLEANHWVHRTHPEAVNQLLEEFVEENQ